MQLIKKLKRSTLIKITYILIGVLLIVSLTSVISLQSPERLIQGTWKEKAWYIEKGESSGPMLINQQGLRNEILTDLELLHYGIWDFQKHKLTTYGMKQEGSSVEWLIKGRGHILELRKAGKRIETFQIQQINDDLLELHLNFDLQVKGVMKIVLERVTKVDNYVKKV
ncbi:hypothetical protein [Sphingobacterium sp. MYb382]|uniref:hypothetical protein n=1 Tax=Sphingobacterium sp. MYb382 TaxID=2745278 RepID=UPI0030A70133